jgi:hypothetical protein
VAGSQSVRRTYQGYADAPVEWQDLLRIFDTLFGQDARHLKRYPEALDNASAYWVDRHGIQTRVTSLDELEAAYGEKETYAVIFSGGLAIGRTCDFTYHPGFVPPTAKLGVQADPGTAASILEVVQAVFPHQRQVVFISQSGQRSLAIGRAFINVLTPRLPPGTEVFISDAITPGTDPYEEMLERNLKVAKALIPILTKEAAESPWVIWETATVWALNGLTIPVFVDVQPRDIRWPIAIVRQGVRLDSRDHLDSAIVQVAKIAGKDTVQPLSDEEFNSLQVGG